MNGKGEVPLILTSLLTIKRMVVIDVDQRLLLVSLFSYDEDYHHERRNRNSSSKGLGNDTMSKALNQISRSPFTCRIEGVRLPRQFIQPTFTMYNGQTNPVEHVSHFSQRMVVHSKNEALMCKVFPSNLGPMAMRWFDGLGAGSIDSFKELTRAFGSCFITCSRVPWPLDSLLSMSMREEETLKMHSNRYWCCEILKYSQVYEPYQSIVGQERG